MPLPPDNLILIVYGMNHCLIHCLVVWLGGRGLLLDNYHLRLQLRNLRRCIVLLLSLVTRVLHLVILLLLLLLLLSLKRGRAALLNHQVLKCLMLLGLLNRKELLLLSLCVPFLLFTDQKLKGFKSQSLKLLR